MNMRALRNGLLLALPLWALVGLAFAHADVFGSLPVQVPPPPFDHPYNGQTIVTRVHWDEVALKCSDPGEERGCAWAVYGQCHIVLAIELSDREYQALRFHHEPGHCNDWPADHPGGHY